MTVKQALCRVRANPLILKLYISNIYQRNILDKGIDVVAEDWDNLIILDGCSFPIFEDSASINGDLRKVVSPGSGTGEFLRSVLSDADLSDTVYVTATPGVNHVSQDIEVQLHDVINVWETDWDDELQTVVPETMARRAVEALEEYPQKRLIVHFMQPHYPFIGPLGRDIQHRTYGVDTESISEDQPSKSIWIRLKNGEVDEETVRNAYKENLEITLPHVQALIEEVPGKTVVTSDHGNAFGEAGIYGHTVGVYLPELIEVPWMVCDYDTRREIRAGSDSDLEVNSELVEERLEDLGYVGSEDAF
jgi:hypothetical protein